MSAVTVTPVIGRPSKDRLTSLSGCHAIWEDGVTKSFRSPDEIGEAIAGAVYEIALAQAAGRKIAPTVDEVSYLLQFRL